MSGVYFKMSIDFDHYTNGILEPIADHIIVKDIESEEEKIIHGIIILSEQGVGRGIRPRWAQVFSVGNEQHDVEPGQWILVEHGKWTRGVRLDDNDVYRKVDPDGIMIVSDEKPEDI